MGTIYYVACRDCQTVRDLDKFYALVVPAENRAEALKLSEELGKPGWSFRCGLLTSFLWKHKGHNCTVFSEHDAECEELNPCVDHEWPKEEKTNFWKGPYSDDPA